MLNILRSLFTKPDPDDDVASINEPAPHEVSIEGLPPFRLDMQMKIHNGLPILDWEAVHAWVGGAPLPGLKAMAWSACERAWLLHLRDALGADYQLTESDGAALLSSLESNLVRSTLDYMERTLSRVSKVLDGIAQAPEWGKDILIVFDDYDVYYNYVSFFYPEEGGEFAFSSGMHIDEGCSHYVTVKADLRSVEPVIAHEMTHGALAHLPLPLWLNEGLAVNTERRLAGGDSSPYTPQEMHEKHLAFWGDDEIQEFWSGKSFHRPDDGNLLSYDLARIMVEQMSKDWERFKLFVLNADWQDGGADSAQAHLGISLGEAACALLEKTDSCKWMPDPKSWK